MQIRIHILNADPDPGGKMNADPCGSGSTALALRSHLKSLPYLPSSNCWTKIVRILFVLTWLSKVMAVTLLLFWGFSISSSASDSWPLESWPPESWPSDSWPSDSWPSDSRPSDSWPSDSSDSWSSWLSSSSDSSRSLYKMKSLNTGYFSE